MTALLDSGFLVAGAVLGVSLLASVVCEAMEAREVNRRARNHLNLARVLRRARR